MKLQNYSNYEIYPEDGKILSLITNKYIGSNKSTKGKYCYVHLIDDNGNRKHWRLHRLIWTAVYGDIPEGYDIHHIDEDKNNNSISNLRLISHEEHVTLHWKDKKHTEQHIEKCIAPQRKAVAKYTMDGTFIQYFISTKDAQRRDGSNSAGISMCARGLRDNFNGYKWKYITDNQPMLFVN